MRLQSVLTGLSRTRRGLVLLGGISAVLTGVEVMLSRRSEAARSPQRIGTRTRLIPQPLPVLVNIGLVAPVSVSSRREHYFTVRQTRSELGYVYWVLHGFGAFQSFALFDTWQEAIEEATRRLSEASVSPLALALL